MTALRAARIALAALVTLIAAMFALSGMGTEATWYAALALLNGALLVPGFTDQLVDDTLAALRGRVAVYTVPAHNARPEIERMPWGCVVLCLPLLDRALCIQWNDHDKRVTKVEGVGHRGTYHRPDPEPPA